jgi:toxin YoeB
MGKYIIQLSKKALSDIQKIKKSGRKLDIERIEKFIKELKENPRIGTGLPERLKYYDGEVWSREINKRDRFVYEIFEDKVLVVVVQSLGHYDAK